MLPKDDPVRIMGLQIRRDGYGTEGGGFVQVAYLSNSLPAIADVKGIVKRLEESGFEVTMIPPTDWPHK